MIFVILGIAILAASFVIAFISLLREQKTLKENSKSVKEDELEVKVKKLSFKKTEEIEVPSIAKSQRIIHHEESGVDERFPWEEPPKKLSYLGEQNQDIIEEDEETTSFGQKLGGEISIGDLVQKRKAQKDSASK
jgi:hypothetical protein